MQDLQSASRGPGFKAANNNEPEEVLEYQLRKPKPWWAFWRAAEWETLRSASRMQMRRADETNPSKGSSLRSP